jgi:hypothetical protein
VTWPRQPIDTLIDAFQALPGSPHAKARLRAALLRMRIERIVLDLPATVVHPSDRATCVRYKLLVSAGDPALPAYARQDRLRLAWRTAAAYAALSSVLHGHTASLYPSEHDLDAWDAEITALETHLQPQPRGSGSATHPGDTHTGVRSL